MGVVGIYVHGLKSRDGVSASKGQNPFELIKHGPTKKKLSNIVKCYNPAGATSREKYDWIARNIAAAIDEAVRIRKENK